MPDDRARARDWARMVRRRSEELDRHDVAGRRPDPDHPERHELPLLYVPGELTTDDWDSASRLLDDAGFEVDRDRRDDDRPRGRLRLRNRERDPREALGRARERLPAAGGPSIGLHRILTLAQKPRIGPGSDPYQPPGDPVVGPRLARSRRIGIVDTGQWEGLLPALAGVQILRVDPVDETPPANVADYPGAAHGGFIAGVVLNSTGGSGSGVGIVSVRAFDGGLLSEDSVVRAVDSVLAEDDVAIVNLSLGTYDLPEEAGDLVILREAMRRWVADAGSSRVLFVAAAGNDEHTAPWYPAGFAAEDEFADHVVSVGALESRHVGPGVHSAAASFTNHGSWVTAWAPGVEVVSSYPDDLLFDYDGIGIGADVTDDGTTAWDGTSFAAPFVAAEIMRYAMDNTQGDAVEAWRRIRGDSPFVVFWPSWG